MQKRQLGQFFTVNSDYILSGFSPRVKGKKIVDPFAGSGDLLKWAHKHGAASVKGFDVDRQYVDGKTVFLRDSLKANEEYDFVLTNPPYLNVNKAAPAMKEKYFSSSPYEDLYQISLASILKSREGIVIVPINFLSAENSRKIRDLFLSTHRITRINYFKQRVFPDTTYNVIAFHYRKEGKILEAQNPRFVIYPDGKEFDIELHRRDGWSIGAEVLQRARTPNFASIQRLTEGHIRAQRGSRKVVGVINHIADPRTEFQVSDEMYRLLKGNIIFLRAIDSGSDTGKIDLQDIREYGIDCLVSKPTSRHMIQLIFPRPPDIEVQKELISAFNKDLARWREKYDSLFLTNYRDKDRKRIGFDFVYGYLNYLLRERIQAPRRLSLRS